MLSDYLKEHSRKDHDSIESSIDLVKCASDLTVYTSLIKAFYGYYLPMENIFDQYQKNFSDIGINIVQRHKVKLLEDDLRHLGLSANEISEIKICTSLPKINNFQDAMGALYVLEGSTMGGQIIFRQLGKSKIIQNDEERGRFFKAYGPLTMEMWNGFKKSLNTIPEEQNDVVLKTARETFNTLEAWLTKNV